MNPLEILSMSFKPIDIPDRLQKSCEKCGTALCGAYLLIDAGAIVYVGTSVDLVNRIYSHVSDRSRSDRDKNWPHGKQFDRAMWMPLPVDVAKHYEGALIRELRPRYNASAPRHLGHDSEILWLIGLRDELIQESA